MTYHQSPKIQIAKPYSYSERYWKAVISSSYKKTVYNIPLIIGFPEAKFKVLNKRQNKNQKFKVEVLNKWSLEF